MYFLFVELSFSFLLRTCLPLCPCACSQYDRLSLCISMLILLALLNSWEWNVQVGFGLVVQTEGRARVDKPMDITSLKVKDCSLGFDELLNVSFVFYHLLGIFMFYSSLFSFISFHFRLKCLSIGPRFFYLLFIYEYVLAALLSIFICLLICTLIHSISCIILFNNLWHNSRKTLNHKSLVNAWWTVSLFVPNSVFSL